MINRRPKGASLIEFNIPQLFKTIVKDLTVYGMTRDLSTQIKIAKIVANLKLRDAVGTAHNYIDTQSIYE